MRRLASLAVRFAVVVGAMAAIAMVAVVAVEKEGFAEAVVGIGPWVALGRWTAAGLAWGLCGGLLKVLRVRKETAAHVMARRHWYLAGFLLFEAVLAISPGGVLADR